MCPLYGGVLTLGVSKHANVAFGTVISVLISEVQISEVPLPPRPRSTRGVVWGRDYNMSVTRSVTRSLAGSFQWPWQYDFKPFFTIQPNLDTRARQLDAWCELVLAYHRHTKSYVMDVSEALSSELFCNTKINRILLILIVYTLNILFMCVLVPSIP